MTRNSAKKLALKIVRDWGHFLPSFGDLQEGFVYAPYIPFYATPDIQVGVDHAQPGTERMVFLMRQIEERVRYVTEYDPVLESMKAELQEHRIRMECCHRRPPPDILCGREFATQFEAAMRRYAEADVQLSRFYGTFKIET